jgi:hypothetical protein
MERKAFADPCALVHSGQGDLVVVEGPDRISHRVAHVRQFAREVALASARPRVDRNRRPRHQQYGQRFPPGGFRLFETFDTEIGSRAKQAQLLVAQASRLAKQLRKGVDLADVHLLRQKVVDAAARASEAAAALEELRAAVEGFAVAAATEVAATTSPDGEGAAAYGRDFERACADVGVPLEGAYPDYRVFPFDVRLRLAEERAIIGRKSWWALRPDAVAAACRRERDRLMGGAFAADKFGQALARAYDVLILEVRARSGAGAQQVPLRDVLELLQLPTFGRASYTKDEFAFDLYRYRQTGMQVGTRRVIFGDLRNAGAGCEVPNGRGGRDRLTGLQVTPAEDAGDGR